MDLNRDEVRRELRDIERAQRDSERAQKALIDAVFEEVPAEQRARVLLPDLDRRGFLRAGGLVVASTAFLAACRNKKAKKQLPIAGENPGFKAITDKTVDDVVLLRTATSLEYSVIDAYQKMLDNGFLTDAAITDLVKVFQAHHYAHAALFAQATKDAGGTACTKLNDKITSYLIQPLLEEIGANRAGKGEDAKALAHALENLAAATYQSVVPTLSQPALRAAAMSVGSVEARHAALLAAVVNPDQLVGGGAAKAAGGASAAPTTTVVTGLPTTAPAATTTTVPTATSANVIVAVPGTFGSLAPIPLTVGAPNESGVRKTTNMETPSLNSYIYADEEC